MKRRTFVMSTMLTPVALAGYGAEVITAKQPAPEEARHSAEESCDFRAITLGTGAPPPEIERF